MIIFTNCKINIGLYITAKRSDGYHDIATCMVPVPWHDVVEIVPAHSDTTSLTVLGNTVDCPPEKNLVMKAYRALKEMCSLPDVDIILQKNVPDGAGLGGGSSDAAHTLLLLNDMFSLSLSKAELCKIAAKIGADCSFFIYNEPMICEGIGDIMTPAKIDLSGYTIVIAKPMDVCISTREAYEGVTPKPMEQDLSQLLTLPVEKWQGSIVNDFEASIFPKAPRIAQLKAMMLDSGAVYAAMSGSGASVFGIFNNDNLAEKALESVASLPHFSFKLH